MSKKEQIIEILTLNPFISQKELAEKIGLSRPAVANYIATLTREGIIKGRAYILQEETIVCIGAVNIDRIAKTKEPVQFEASNPVEITETIGGVARNYAHTLQQLHIQTSMITAVGDDTAGEMLLQTLNSDQINTDQVWIFPNEKTGTYTSLVSPTNESIVSMADMNIYEQITPKMIDNKWPHIQSAKGVFLDTNFNTEAITHIIERLQTQQIPIFIDTVSPSKAKHLPEDLSFVKLISLTTKELETLSRHTITNKKDMKQGAKTIIDRGAENIIIFHENEQLVYASKHDNELRKFNKIPNIKSEREQDALAACILSGLLKEKTIQQAIQQSVSLIKQI
ncbi:MAG TPA: PfkB family carbohydrate kinase [Bacillota bacterium]|nr:PfkB family carbohydrate kinase [Bacillota bacterium]